jgi:hypothetical protein
MMFAQYNVDYQFYLNPFRMAIIKDYNNNKCGKDVVKQKPFYTVGVNAN